MSGDNFLELRRSFLKPIPQISLAAELISKAADCFLIGDLDLAQDYLKKADITEIGEFTRSIASCISVEVHRVRVVESAPPYLTERVTKRMPSKSLENQIYNRDGWRCRFCDSKVISKTARKILNENFPDAARWGSKNIQKHYGLALMESTLDHITPHSRGGDNEPNNLVTACGPCQFGRGGWVLDEVGLLNPFLFEPIVDDWDGLTRLIKNH